MKKLLGIMLALVMMIGTFAGCGATSNGASAGGTSGADNGEMKELTVGVIDGSLAGEIVWVAEKEGIFAANGVKVNMETFTNGMVMLEAIDTLDVALTGIGGILAGTINYDTQIFSVIAPDSGTQHLYVRPDSDIVAAGQGHNTLNPEIYGDADSWRGKEVFCTNGNVLQYLLMNVLDGFGLTLDDVNVTWMDMPTCNASFLAGEGDAATVTGSVSYAEDKKDYVVAATGPMCDLGLTTCMLAAPEKIEAADTHSAMVAFLTACFESVDWIFENTEEAEAYMVEWCEYCGQECTPELAKTYLQADPNYRLDEVYEMMHTPAESGDYTQVEEQILKILDFYIQCENYEEADKEKFLDNHLTTSIIDEVYAAKNA